MAEALSSFRVFVEQLILSLDYLGIAVVAAITAPELVLPLAGFLVDRGQLSLFGVVAAGAVGGLIGHLGVYLLARWYGETRVRGLFRKYGHWMLLTERDLDQGMARFERHNGWLLVVGRFLPTARSLVSVVAGIVGIAAPRYVVLTLAGVAGWSLLLVSAGAALGRNWQLLLDYLAIYENVVWAALIALLVVLVFRRVRDTARLRRGEG